jgi:glycosyltransferase involved in cell wall biosynthesis
MHDALWAFCWAFRDMPEITLVIALKQADLLAATDRVLTALYTLEPFQCRVVMLGGLLAAGEYRQLIQATSFVLSSACAQAQGLSMMQFMSAGVPVIAPRHTAAADYLDDRCALVVKSSPEWVEWPHDPRIVRRAFRQRINWQSMLEAVQQSHRLAIEDGDAYAAMSQSAIENQRQFCSYAVVSASLAAFFAAEGFSRARSPGGHGALQPAIVRSGGLWLKLKHGIKKRLGLVN